MYEIDKRNVPYIPEKLFVGTVCFNSVQIYLFGFLLVNTWQITRRVVKVGGFSSALEQSQAEEEEEEENNKTFCCCLLPFPQFEIFAGELRGDGDVLSSGQENILFGKNQVVFLWEN